MKTFVPNGTKLSDAVWTHLKAGLCSPWHIGPMSNRSKIQRGQARKPQTK